MKIAIGADHRGFHHKEYIKQHSTYVPAAIAWIDVGVFDVKRSDYPLFAQLVCQEILRGKAERGILICGSGIGMAVAANRYKGIYAGLVWNETIARISREHDNTNVLVIPSDFVPEQQSVAMVEVWLAAQFLAGRYQERIAMIDKLPL